MVIKILGKQVALKILPDNEFTNPTLMGRCDSKKGLILVSTEMPPDNQEETLLHETIHYLSDLLYINLNEKQVVALASGLYAFIKENELPNPVENLIKKLGRENVG